LQGSAGMRMYSEELLEILFDTCNKEQILIVSDEVLTGFGRTGNLFASIHQQIKPDIMALSKGITGGILPLGVTLVNEKVLRAFDTADKTKTFYHGHSYTANPICCAVANKNIELLERKESVLARKNINRQHVLKQEQFSKHTKIKEARVLGTILALEIVNEQDSSYFNPLREVLYQKAIEKGVLLRPLGNVLYVIPPYCITKEELNKVYQVIEEILDEI
jgi:adenosylmethionine-8-amino-7-oxononanoate aminotransferase